MSTMMVLCLFLYLSQKLDAFSFCTSTYQMTCIRLPLYQTSCTRYQTSSCPRKHTTVFYGSSDGGLSHGCVGHLTGMEHALIGTVSAPNMGCLAYCSAVHVHNFIHCADGLGWGFFGGGTNCCHQFHQG